MVKKIYEAKTVDKAIELGLQDLGKVRDEVEISIIEEGGKGFLGIGAKEAKVEISFEEEVAEISNASEEAPEQEIVAEEPVSLEPIDIDSPEGIAIDFLTSVFESMGQEVDIVCEEQEDSITFDIKGNNVGKIIGRHGETLDAIQYITNLAVNNKTNNYKRIVIDVEGYRAKRKEALEKLAKRMANQAIKTNRNVTLEPMNAYERRIIHSTLQNNIRVETKSIGEDSRRRVVISIK